MIVECPTPLCHWHYCAPDMEEPTLCKEPCTPPQWAGGTCRCRNCLCEGGTCMIAPLYEWVWHRDHEVWNYLCIDEGCMHCAPLRGTGRRR
jgi:hypothetical protein